MSKATCDLKFSFLSSLALCADQYSLIVLMSYTHQKSPGVVCKTCTDEHVLIGVQKALLVRGLVASQHLVPSSCVFYLCLYLRGKGTALPAYILSCTAAGQNPHFYSLSKLPKNHCKYQDAQFDESKARKILWYWL